MKLFYFILMAVLILSCNNNSIEAPDNLIEKDKMITILYDFSVLEAIKSSNPSSLTNRNIDAKTYIFKKYKIDSLQFAKSNKFYASDVAKYAKMYEAVNLKLEAIKSQTDTLIKRQTSATK